MSAEEKRQNQDSWKEITFLGIASVFMLVILYFSVRMTMRLAEPLNAVKYGAWHAMKFDEMQRRIDDMEERLRKLEVDGKKTKFSSDGTMYGEPNTALKEAQKAAVLREKRREYNRRYYQEHKESIRVSAAKFQRKWYQANKEKCLERMREYQRTHAKELREYRRRYRARRTQRQ